jgi:hypothetical protein
MYEKVEMLLLNSVELKHVLTFYGDDFDPLQLSTQLEVLSNYFSSKDKVVLSDNIEFFQTSSSGPLELLSQVTKLISLLLIMPATNSDRSVLYENQELPTINNVTAATQSPMHGATCAHR